MVSLLLSIDPLLVLHYTYLVLVTLPRLVASSGGWVHIRHSTSGMTWQRKLKHDLAVVSDLLASCDLSPA